MTNKKTFGGVRVVAGAVVRWMGSLKVTIVLLVHLGAVLGYAKYLEEAKGLEFAQSQIYRSDWLVALLVALAVNIAAAALTRISWQWNRAALLIAPAGLLVLLAGFIQTLVQGIDGRLILQPGATAERVMLTHRSQFTLVKESQRTELRFSPGPADWPEDRQLDFGGVNGVGIKVLRFYRYARYQREWVADETGQEKPVILVALPDSQGGEPHQRWCAPVLFGNPPAAKENLSIEQASVPSLRDDFLQSPTLKPGSRGILSMHYQDRVYRFPVDGNTGKKLPLGDSGLAVEMVDYLANAKFAKGEFYSEGSEPKNPMLRLRVHAPGQKEPVSEIAYASKPFVNFESLKKQKCPVKFWYHHPAVKVTAGAEFLQTPDGKLYCRVGVDGAYQPRGEVKQGDRITVSADVQMSLLRYLPHARQESTFAPIEPAPGETSEAEAAALVELTTAERSEQFWLGRNDPRFGVRKIETPDGPWVMTFGYETRPLGSSVTLVGFQRDKTSDAVSDASWISTVCVSDGTRDPKVIRADNPPREVCTGSPVRFGNLTFYQSGSQQSPDHVDSSVLRVTSDPGRLLKYAGGAMICGGVVLMLCLRAFARRPVGLVDVPTTGCGRGVAESLLGG